MVENRNKLNNPHKKNTTKSSHKKNHDLVQVEDQKEMFAKPPTDYTYKVHKVCGNGSFAVVFYVSSPVTHVDFIFEQATV